jgi:hypothetical protein
MDVIKALARKLRAVIGDDNNGFYVSGSGPIRVPNARVHQIPKVIAEHHRDSAKRELERALMIGRR